MNHLVLLDARAGELEKILSGVKTMLVKEFDPPNPVNPGDTLYFLRGPDENAVRGKATVLRVLACTDPLEKDLTHILKEMQPRLQLTEDQYNAWSGKQHILLVEFESAQKIGAIHVNPQPAASWAAFDEVKK
jgi:hypothetical protein